jgi:hypothetical protein
VRGTGTLPDDGTLRRTSYRSSRDEDIDGAWRDALDAPELSRLSLSLELLSTAALLLRGISDRRRLQSLRHVVHVVGRPRVEIRLHLLLCTTSTREYGCFFSSFSFGRFQDGDRLCSALRLAVIDSQLRDQRQGW